MGAIKDDEQSRDPEGWVDLIDASEVPESDHRYVEAEGIRLLVHHVGDRFYVTSSQCPHEEFTMDRCVLDQGVITCTEHGWKMDVRTGAVVDIGDEDAHLPTWPAEVRNGRVWARLF